MVSRRVVDVLYGSETGNAESIARRIHGEVNSNGLQPGVLEPIKNYDAIAIGDPDGAQKWSERLAVFIISTTGEGDPPQNASALMRFLRKKTNPDDMLSGFNYVLLGLGDTNYTNFCNGAVRLEKALKGKGAANVYYTGKADDEVGLDAVVEPWIEGLWDAVNKHFSAAERVSSSNPLPAIEKVAVDSAVSAPKPSADGSALDGVPPLPEQRRFLREAGNPAPEEDAPEYVWATVTGALKLTSEGSERRVWDIEVECDLPVEYEPGDSFGVFPRNADSDVDALLALLGENGERPCALYEGEKCIAAPQALRDLLAERCDLTSPASKRMLRALAEHCSDADDRQRLLLWSSKTGRAEYEKEVVRSRATALDLLRANPSCRPPAGLLVDQLATLQPRSYSAASAREVDGQALHFAFSVVQFVGADGSERRGVATGYLEDICNGIGSAEATKKRLKLVKRPSTSFVPPKDPAAPYIMIGPGTGVAPFIGFLKQRAALSAKDRTAAARVELFFGCRRNAEDFLYHETLDEMVANGTLSALHVAFSREQEHKVYVQDRLKECGAELAGPLLDDPSFRVFVCGDGGAMAKGVQDSLEGILVQHGGLPPAEAKARLVALANEGRYLRDVWYWG